MTTAVLGLTRLLLLIGFLILPTLTFQIGGIDFGKALTVVSKTVQQGIPKVAAPVVPGNNVPITQLIDEYLMGEETVIIPVMVTRTPDGILINNNTWFSYAVIHLAGDLVPGLRNVLTKSNRKSISCGQAEPKISDAGHVSSNLASNNIDMADEGNKENVEYSTVKARASPNTSGHDIDESASSQAGLDTSNIGTIKSLETLCLWLILISIYII